MPDGWRCPECGLILAPTVTEHRCDPPSAGVPALKPVPGGDPDLTAMAVREVQRGIASIDEVKVQTAGMPEWTVNVSPDLSDAQVRKLAARIQAELLKQAQRNRRWPGSAA